jgi:hypothetical protein
MVDTLTPRLPPGLPYKHVELVWSHDLDAYIEQHLGRPWSLQQNGMFGQETLVSYEVWPNPEVRTVVEAWLGSAPAKFPGRLNQPGFAEDVEISTDELLQELCNRDLLPEGDLIVHVWW